MQDFPFHTFQGRLLRSFVIRKQCSQWAPVWGHFGPGLEVAFITEKITHFNHSVSTIFPRILNYVIYPLIDRLKRTNLSLQLSQKNWRYTQWSHKKRLDLRQRFTFHRSNLTGLRKGLPSKTALSPVTSFFKLSTVLPVKRSFFWTVDFIFWTSTTSS